MDKNFDILEQRFKGEVNFVKLNWESPKAKSAIDRFDLGSPPASVLGDSKGNVVQKMESAKGVDEMAGALKRILGKPRNPESK